jgi:hypothetical protein
MIIDICVILKATETGKFYGRKVEKEEKEGERR